MRPFVPLEELWDLLSREELDRLAVHTNVDAVNQIRLTGPAVFLCLLNTVLTSPVVTQRMLEALFERWFVEDVHYSAFSYRLKVIRPAFFEAIFRTVHGRVQPLIAFGDERALRLRIVDATTVVLSAKLMAFGIRKGSGGRAGPGHVKRHVKSVLELSGDGWPSFLHLCREQKENSDNPALGDPMIAATLPGDLWIVDAGLSDRSRMLALHQKEGFFLVPASGQKVRALQTLWEASAFASEEARTAPPPRWERRAAGKGKCSTPPCRLRRVEEAVFENSNDAVEPASQAKWAQMPLLVLHAERWDTRTQRWKPLVLLTNLPLTGEKQDQAGPYSFGELLELYRRRWEIELFFKFVKQHLSYDHLTSRNANGITVMIWMALIAAVLLIWYRDTPRPVGDRRAGPRGGRGGKSERPEASEPAEHAPVPPAEKWGRPVARVAVNGSASAGRDAGGCGVPGAGRRSAHGPRSGGRRDARAGSGGRRGRPATE
jgi:hypothetical protein